VSVRVAAGLAVVALLVSGCGPGGSVRSLGVPLGEQVEPAAREDALQFPAPPAAADLIEFRVASASGMRHYVDGRSITSGRDDIVRFTVVTRSSAGSESITYEGFRCTLREHRVLGYGRSDGTWSASKNEGWRRLPAVTTADYRATLYRDFLCPRGVPIVNAREGIEALRAGLHPRMAE
jgi:hypothetical protein